MKVRSNTVGGVLIAVTASLLAVVVLGGSGRAQYPPPTGNVTLVAETTTAAVGSSVPIRATVRDQYGSVVAGVACSFEIVSQPGTAASVVRGPVTTDENGVAGTTLNTGTSPGTIVVEAICGELSSQVSVVVGAPAPGLPPTGGGDVEMSAGVVWVLAIIAGMVLGIGVMLAVEAVRGARVVRG